MENKIKEVQDYFKSKLLNGEFIITEESECTVDIIIDGKYNFCIWMANTPQRYNLYNNNYNFIDPGLSREDSMLLSSVMHRKLSERED